MYFTNKKKKYLINLKYTEAIIDSGTSSIMLPKIEGEQIK